MMKIHCSFSVIPIDAASARMRSQSASTGAEVCFVGTVRPKRDEREVMHLEFEAYESMALKELHGIAETCGERWPLEEILIVHRLGIVSAGEVAVVLWVFSNHRKEAFEASMFIMDELKKKVPIWKKEVYSDGASWISSTP
jgi:molybdopterin synthase catalytic subunit